MDFAIKTKDLTKKFYLREGIFNPQISRVTSAVNHVNLEIKKGELFGIMGENGAGKTTLIKIFCTLIIPDEGSVFINGYDVVKEDQKVKESIGLIAGDGHSFYRRLTGRQNLEFFGTLFNLSVDQINKRIIELSDLLSLHPFLDKRYDLYSTGMKQRLGIVRGLLHQPEILFFDEPTKSLDPAAAKTFRKIIKSLSGEGYTIVLVTHQLDEAEEICDRVGLMIEGKIEIPGSMNKLRDYFHKN